MPRGRRADDSLAHIYDRIGAGYARTRRPDPRVAEHISRALGDAASVVNVGAGVGSYEPGDRAVVAVEPSATMLRQRPAGPARAIRGAAEALPLGDRTVDAALAVLTVHHWRDPLQGLREMRRVSRKRVVVLTWDPPVFERFWLIREYFGCIREIDRARAVAVETIASAFGESRVICVPVPHDCVDGFLGAFWRRPRAYLDPAVRSGISAFAAMSAEHCQDGLNRLAADLESGAWQERQRALLQLDELDLGYRLILA